jgi:ubiquitin carboxyl-terminal hydrolase 4/11/15
MASKLGDSPHKSAAAYLLFYRRRSDKPLGPSYLQELVTDFRNPPQQQADSADESYQSDSGEGRLGDPSSILRGSSSNSVGAGVGATTGLQHQAQNTLLGGGNGSAGQQAGQSLKQRTQGTSDDDEGISMVDDKPAGNKYGNTGSEWSFGVLDNADTDPETALLENFDRGDADVDSNAADHDTDREDSWNDLGEAFQYGGDTSMNEDYEDDHGLYSNAHAYESEALHLEDPEDTRMVSDEPPTVDINLSDDKMD